MNREHEISGRFPWGTSSYSQMPASSRAARSRRHAQNGDRHPAGRDDSSRNRQRWRRPPSRRVVNRPPNSHAEGIPLSFIHRSQAGGSVEYAATVTRALLVGVGFFGSGAAVQFPPSIVLSRAFAASGVAPSSPSHVAHTASPPSASSRGSPECADRLPAA